MEHEKESCLANCVAAAPTARQLSGVSRVLDPDSPGLT